jgi:hypothetical protein
VAFTSCRLEASMARLFPLHLILCAAPAFMLAPAALAQTAIGGASVVVNDVRGDTAGKRARITLGDRVFANQGVQTATQSMAKFVFLDDTNMTLGPDSRVKLDRFVFDPDGAGKNIAVTAAKGAFRFVSGKSPSEAYKVTTPHAHIGVRGTTYDVRVENGRTLVVLQEGAVNVCLRNSARCRELNQPGQSLVVTDNDISAPAAPANKPWDFGDLCKGGAADLCGATQFAQLPPAQTRHAAAPPPRRTAPAPQRAARPEARPTRVVSTPRPQPRPVRAARAEIMDEEIVYVRQPMPFGVAVGPGWRPRGDGRVPVGPGWRPQGDGRAPVGSGPRRPQGDGRVPVGSGPSRPQGDGRVPVGQGSRPPRGATGPNIGRPPAEFRGGGSSGTIFGMR